MELQLVLGDVINVLNKKTYENPLNYLSPSFYGTLLGASDMTLIIVSEGLAKAAYFNSNSDYSWICTEEGVVRAKYGHLWVEDPSKGNYSWSDKKS